KRSGADGVVLGALRADGAIDEQVTTALAEHAHPLRVTFHRAFDMTRDPVESLAALKRTGIELVLTSGGAASARAGIPVLASLVRDAGNRVTILAGGGITEDNAMEIVAATGVREVHVRGAVREESAMRYRATGVALSRATQPDDLARVVTSAECIRQIALALERHQ
ncbi:MAG: copper homeostasis protein CutC, partial [Gemmatimonadaceae bacterium]